MSRKQGRAPGSPVQPKPEYPPGTCRIFSGSTGKNRSFSTGTAGKYPVQPAPGDRKIRAFFRKSFSVLILHDFLAKEQN